MTGKTLVRFWNLYRVVECVTSGEQDLYCEPDEGIRACQKLCPSLISWNKLEVDTNRARL